MSITSFSRGHLIIYTQGQWVYKDTKETIETIRPCKRCGKMPTKEGYDACLGKLENVKDACCGHGVTESYVRRMND